MAGSITDCMLCAILQVFARTFEQPKDTKAVEVECAHILPSSFGKFKEGEGFIISRMRATVFHYFPGMAEKPTLERGLEHPGYGQICYSLGCLLRLATMKQSFNIICHGSATPCNMRCKMDDHYG